MEARATYNAGGTSGRIEVDRFGWVSVGGIRVPAVTRVLGVLNKPKLVDWAARRVADYVAGEVRRYDRQEQTLDELLLGLRDDEGLARTPWRERSSAAELGSLVHAIVGLLARGQQVALEEIQADARPYVQALLAWAEREQPIWHDVEVPGARLSDPRYGGVVDAYATIHGLVHVLEVKAQPRIYPETELQVVAYSRLTHLRDGAIAWNAIPAVLQVQPTGCRLVRVEDPEGCWQCFQALLRVYEWQRAREYGRGGGG